MKAKGSIVWHERLRFRLIGIQLLVVLIGVGVMLLAMQLLVANGAAVIRPILSPHIEADAVAQIEAELIDEFRRAVILSVSVAALGALAAGATAGILLWRTLVIPLRRMAAGSQRIAGGHFDERVPVPTQSGEAMQQLARGFNRMAHSLETVEEQRVTLIGNVAHELRTPLSGLRGLAEGLEDGIFQPEPKTFGLMTREIDRLTRLVDDLTHLSRVEAGAEQFHFEDFVMCDVVQRVFLHLQTQAEEKGIELAAQEADPPMRVHGDSDRTAQILTNLIANAIRYTPAGGSVRVVLAPVNRMAQVQVIDTGIGIAKEDLPHLFERFYRVDLSRSRQSGGSGVGLTIARHLTWGLGGELSAESPGPGKGCTFTLTLPLSNR